MSLFKRRVIISLIIAGILVAISGCVPPEPPAPVEMGISIPIPITSNYLAANIIPVNVTVNTSGATLNGIAFMPIYNNGSITVTRNSTLVVQWSGEIGVNGTYSSYMLIQLGGVNMTASPQIITSNTNDTYSVFDTRAVVVYNASVSSGTYSIVPYVNGSSASAVITIGRNVLIATAYPG